jgi:5-deoxy-glucuronate isomerase
VGNRATVFENRKAVSFYMPIGQKLQIEGDGHVKIAVCGAVVTEKTAPQLLGEEHVVLKKLGIQPWERETSFIIDGNSNAKVLTIGEAYCTKGNWAGFPPHKHDEDNMPTECICEEIYYFLFDPKQGFAVQCLYTSDGEIDECYRVKNDELVEFPRGFHSTVSTPGYKTYFLWLMAGDYQGFNRSNDPEHDWIK